MFWKKKRTDKDQTASQREHNRNTYGLYITDAELLERRAKHQCYWKPGLNPESAQCRKAATYRTVDSGKWICTDCAQELKDISIRLGHEGIRELDCALGYAMEPPLQQPAWAKVPASAFDSAVAKYRARLIIATTSDQIEAAMREYERDASGIISGERLTYHEQVMKSLFR